MKQNQPLLFGNRVRDYILRDVDNYVKAAKNIGRIVSITVGSNKEVEIYIRNQLRTAKKLGFDFDQQLWESDILQEECKTRIQDMNDDPDILGIIIQRPLPSHINIRSLQSAVHPLKDLEGMNPASIGNIVYSDVALVPCTAAASVEMIKSTGLNLEGLEVVMIGHSEIVGRPIAMMLMSEGATVTVCHHMTRSVAMHSRRADVVIVAVGSPHLVGPDMIKPGAAVIDIGINQILNDEGINTVVGDVDTKAVLEVAGWITPVPGGVGPVTVAMLMRNATIAHKRQQQIGWA
jgi:methylenetetrahydrofolate dehydrogenase (NADP+)/methenyltetrahydrofolate cyclohydrolase